MSVANFDPNTINPADQLLDLDRADCEESLYEFLKAAWKYMDPAPWKDGWHIDAICEHLQAVVDGKTRRLIINLPPRHGKSLILSVAFPAWIWAQPLRTATSGPGVPLLYASYADKLSLRDSVKSRRLIESPFYQKMWGDRFQLTSDQNTKSRFSNDQGGERLITSIGAGVTGEGGNCFVAGTLVSTPSGQVRIEDMQIGDEVMSFDLLLEKVVISRVLAVAKRLTNDICEIREVSGHGFRCTPDHPIYAPGIGYVCADQVGPKTPVLVSESRELFSDLPSTASLWKVSHVVASRRHCGETHEVYDIQVEGQNNFFAEGILVHNCIIVDDPNAANDVASEAVLESTIEWWTTAMPTRLNDPETGAFVIIQQRLAENDLTGHILEHDSEGWTHLCLPGRYEPERSYHNTLGWKDPRTQPGELLWSERFSETALARLEKTMGPYVFAGQIQQRPEPKGGGIIKREWWKLWEPGTYPPFEFVLACVDTAYTEDTMNDKSAMVIWGIFSGDVQARTTQIIGSQGELIRPNVAYSEFAPKVLCMYSWTEHLEFHKLVEKVAETCVKMKVDTVIIENKASGISVVQELRRLYAREKFGVQTFDPKSQDKAARLYSVQHLFAEGIIYAPDRPWSEELITQVGQFPKGRFKDLVDCTSMGLRKLRDMGLLVRQPEREAEIEASKIYEGRELPLYSV